MASFETPWVMPNQIDPDFDLATINPTAADEIANYEIALQACQAASQLLWSLSGRKYHTGEVASEQYFTSAERAADWQTNIGIGNYVAGLARPYLLGAFSIKNNIVRLAGQPVKAIGSVTELATGRVLDATEYALINRSVIQFNELPTAGVDVSYSYGQSPPALGKLAALQLAREFYGLWIGGEENCNLPGRVASVSREGVSFVLLDNQDFVNDLRAGIYIVDVFLRSVNPGKATRKSKVFSVDISRGKRKSV